jgi:excisionase family DNA binding protein
MSHRQPAPSADHPSPEQYGGQRGRDPDVMTAPDVAKMLGVSRVSVYDAAGRGEIPHRRIGRRMLFSRTAIQDWLRGDEV